jgi:hypothetical protein
MSARPLNAGCQGNRDMERKGDIGVVPQGLYAAAWLEDPGVPEHRMAGIGLGRFSNGKRAAMKGLGKAGEREHASIMATMPRPPLKSSALGAPPHQWRTCC